MSISLMSISRGVRFPSVARYVHPSGSRNMSVNQTVERRRCSLGRRGHHGCPKQVSLRVTRHTGSWRCGPDRRDDGDSSGGGATSGAGAAPASLHLRLHQAPAPASSSPSRRGGRALRALRPESSSGWHQVNEINGNPSSLLGFAIAVSGSTMVVGAGNDNSDTGAAYVYTGSR